MPVTSLVAGATTGQWDGAINFTARKIRDSILNSFKQDSNEQGQTEQIPTISGAKNKSGANQPIPLLIGESMYAPIYGAQSYTDINPADGTDGENQYFHALYCLGYNDVDLKSVSMGIFALSTDRHNGTSGELDCTNLEGQTVTENRRVLYMSVEKCSGTTAQYTRKVKYDTYITDSINAVNSNTLKAYCGDSYLGAMLMGTECTISSIQISGTSLVVNVSGIATGSKYVFLVGSVNVNVTLTEEKGTVHYKTGTYHQALELWNRTD